jgi:hypothetical protein
MPKYRCYLIKKVAQEVYIDADDASDAESKAYELLAKEDFKTPSDPDWDRYVYCDGDIHA